MTPPKKKGLPKFSVGRASRAVAQLSQTDRVDSSVDVRRLESILPRVGKDTRSLRAKHVVTLAESISALSLLEPLVVDAANQLLAGGHRLAACRLLTCPNSKRISFLKESCIEKTLPTSLISKLKSLRLGEFDPESVPVRVLPFRSEEDLERALEIEASENEKRRDYTTKEVQQLYERLKAAGYRTSRGRPKKGEKSAGPMIATIIGKSSRYVRKLLKAEKAEMNVEIRNNDLIYHIGIERHILLKALRRYSDRCDKNTDNSTISMIQDLIVALEKALTEEKSKK